jgi:glyoxylase-like metal-dependent hydrolase (beta-lactamase superfamily II)
MATTPRERPPEIAEGVYRLGTKWVTFYLVAEEAEFTLIDAGYPGYGKYLSAAIDALGAAPDAIRAVIVTHHHADHAGTAERLRSTAGSRVLVGEADAWIVAGKYPSHASPGFTGSRRSAPAGSASWRTARCPEGRSTDRS